VFIADVEYREHRAIARFITIPSALSLAVALLAAGSTSAAAQAVVLSGKLEVGPTGAAIESFSTVVSHGTAGIGPAWFEVRTNSGQIVQFESGTGSRVPAQGKTTVHDWALGRVSIPRTTTSPSPAPTPRTAANGPTTHV
jgi:hypothetical protein